MLPIERQLKIKKLIEIKQNMKISDLSQQLNVSEMTIHRDLKPLIEDGIILKTFGGISLASKTNPIHPEAAPDTCVICNRNTNDKLAYRLILSNNRIEMTCCAHCGLIRHKQLEDQVIQAITHDFLRQTTISAPIMFYVMHTSIDIGCCQPQALAFEHQDHAKKFVNGFGGIVYDFKEAMEAVSTEMKPNTSCCCTDK